MVKCALPPAVDEGIPLAQAVAVAVAVQAAGFIMTAEEVADWLSTDRTSIYRLARGGAIPCFHIGRRVRFSRGALEQWIADGGTSPQNAA